MGGRREFFRTATDRTKKLGFLVRSVAVLKNSLRPQNFVFPFWVLQQPGHDSTLDFKDSIKGPHVAVRLEQGGKAGQGGSNRTEEVPLRRWNKAKVQQLL